MCQHKGEEHANPVQSESRTEKASTCSAKERLNNTRNRDGAADTIQEKVQIRTEMKIEKRHTYLG